MYQSNSMQMYEKRKENEEQNNILQESTPERCIKKQKNKTITYYFQKS